MAGRPRLRVRASARDGFRGRAQGARAAAIGVPDRAVTFNVGVEAGQLAVIGAAFLLVGGYRADCAWYRRRIVIPASMGIACTAVYWTIQRL